MNFSEEYFVELFEKSHVYQYISIIVILLIGLFIYFADELPIVIFCKENIKKKLTEYKERTIVSLIVNDNEIQNNNSSSLRNIALHLLEII